MAYSSRSWRAVFFTQLEFVSVWRSWMNWDMLSEAEACYSKYILIKAEVYVER